jgi:fructose-specific phosphotransferase system IIA component
MLLYSAMKITDVLSAPSIELQSFQGSKDALLGKMVDLLQAQGAVADAPKVLSVILDRERIMSTGIGHGFAFPHAKSDAVTQPVASLMTLKEPLDYQSLDNQPVNLIFMLVCQENAVGLHLRLLSRISRLMSDESFRIKLIGASAKEEIIAIITEAEEQFD